MACDHPWWIEGDYTDATCKACGVPGWYCPACSPDPDDDADEDCTTCGGSGYVVVHELIARLTRELEEARMAARDARKEAVRLAVEQRDAAAENIRLAAELAEMRRLYADMTLERGRLRGALEEARERERAVRSAVVRSVAALVRLDSRWDPREEKNWVRRESLVRTALRLKDDVLALATPPAEGDGEAGVTTTATHQDSLQVDDGD